MISFMVPFYRKTFTCLAALLCLGTVQAATLDEASAGARADLQAALAELAELQMTIGGEKIPLAQQLNQVEEQLAGRRKDLERTRRDQENQLVDLNVLKAEVKRRNEESGFLRGLLSEYARLFETRIHISEVQRYQDEIQDAHNAAASAELTPAETAERQIALVQRGIERLGNLLGGESFEGQGLTPNGRLESGEFTLLGPLALFSSAQSDTAGVAELQLGSPEATVIALEAESAKQIRQFSRSGEGEVPIDPTSGNALKIAGQKETLWAHIRKGGPVMVPILLLGVAALIICLIKWTQMARIKLATPRDLQAILDHIDEGQKEKALAHARSITGPIGEMLASAIQHVDEKKEYIEEVMYEKMLATKPRLERLMPVIALSAATAPLLGLLGTVTGMINTFNMITLFGTGDPRTLASGISEALITTEFGLIVAIPSLLFHAFISRKAKGVIGIMEQTGVGFINGIPSSEEERNLYA